MASRIVWRWRAIYNFVEAGSRLAVREKTRDARYARALQAIDTFNELRAKRGSGFRKQPRKFTIRTHVRVTQQLATIYIFNKNQHAVR